MYVLITASREGLIAEANLPWRNETKRGVERQAPPAPLAEDEQATPHGLCQQGYHLEEHNEPVRARECYTKAVEADPLCFIALKRLGVLDLKAGLNQEAADHLRTALRVLPEDGEANYYLGMALRRLDRRPEAEDAFWKARVLHPHFGALGPLRARRDGR